MIKGIVKGRTLTVRTDDSITTGSVGMSMSFSFDEEWDGVDRSSVFVGSGKKVVVPIQNGTVIIPYEVLTNKNSELFIGIYGSDGQGNKVIPTIWFGPLPIKEGALTDGASGPGNTPWGQNGNGVVFYGITFAPHVDENGTLTWTNDGGRENPDPVRIVGRDGEPGPQGPQGPEGPQGSSGVYYGSAEPSDPDYDVWINPSGQASIAEIVLELAHPVGSLYWSEDPTDPGTLFGGTWTRVKDKFILAAGDTYAAGGTGGAATVVLDVNQIPSHNHETYGYYPRINDSTASGSNVYSHKDGSGSWEFKTCANITKTRGGGQAHENMPPYETFYCWKRTA